LPAVLEDEKYFAWASEASEEGAYETEFKMAIEVIEILRDEKYGGHDHIDLVYDDKANEFVLRHSIWGRADYVSLTAVEFIKLLKAGLDHYNIGNGVMEKLASKLVQ
jgi:hypothetical protein